MKSAISILLVAALAFATEAALRIRQPVYDGSVDSDAKFGVGALNSTSPGRAPGYRNSWDDCGGVGASATERMRNIAARVKGWAKQVPFVRHAAQDCDMPEGQHEAIVYPDPSVPSTA